MNKQDLTVWEDFKLDINGKLTGEMRKEYIKILENEFQNQSTLYHHQIDEMKDGLIEKYKTKIGFDKLVDGIAEAQAKLNTAKAKLARTGLSEHGSLDYGYGHSDLEVEQRNNAKRVQVDIDKLTNSIKAPTTFKNKIIALMLGATVIGQAQKIMFQVLGNGVLQDVDVKALDFTK